MVKPKEGWKWLNVHMPEEEHDALKKLAAGRKWRSFFKDIQDAARKAAEINQDFRDRIAFKDGQIKRLNDEILRLGKG
uniref:Uncharacterized protein n=1 Tax=viral metagenome TaxID=1070528 RepID=A0A6M3MBP4_9ZZZZ